MQFYVNGKYIFLEYLGSSFLSFVLDNIESPPDTDLDEQIPDLFLNLVISFNLQFDEEDSNPVLVALEDRQIAKIFCEKILLLLNREGKHLFYAYFLNYVYFDILISINS